MTVPASPLTRIRSRPTRFWPKSSDELAAGRLDGRDDGEFLDRAHRLARARLRDDRSRTNGGGSPLVQVAGRRAARIEVLTLIDAASGARPLGRGEPRAVGGEHLGASALVLDRELPGERRLVSIEAAALPREAVLLGEPAAGEVDDEGVVAGAQQHRDVGDVVEQPELIRGPARLHLGVVDRGAVELQVVDALRRGIEDGPPNRLPDGEVTPEQGGLCALAWVGESDELPDPFTVAQVPGENDERLAPVGTRSVLALDPHADTALLRAARAARTANRRRPTRRP